MQKIFSNFFLISFLIINSSLAISEVVVPSLDKEFFDLMSGGDFDKAKKLLSDPEKISKEPVGSVDVNWAYYYGWGGNPDRNQILSRQHMEKAYKAGRLDAHGLFMFSHYIGNLVQLIDYNRGNQLAGEFIVKCIDIIASNAIREEVGICYGALGQMLIYGMGLPRDDKKGLQYLRKGESLGNKSSSTMLDHFLGKDRVREKPEK